MKPSIDSSEVIHLERLFDWTSSGPLEEPARSGSFAEPDEGFGPYHFVGKSFQKVDNLPGSIATGERDLTTGEAMRKLMFVILITFPARRNPESTVTGSLGGKGGKRVSMGNFDQFEINA